MNFLPAVLHKCEGPPDDLFFARPPWAITVSNLKTGTLATVQEAL